jgi:trimethyllysine dioxygenase
MSYFTPWQIPTDIKPVTVQSSSDGLAVKCELYLSIVLSIAYPREGPSNDHTGLSVYPWHWLKRNSYDPSVTGRDLIKSVNYYIPYLRISQTLCDREQVLWGSEIRLSPPTVPHAAVINPDDRGLYEMLLNIVRFF